MLNKRYLVIGGAIAAIALASWFIWGRKAQQDKEIIVPVTRGNFQISVNGTGELKARNQTDILAPAELRQLGIYQIKLSNLVNEGTKVKAGEVVAMLDPTELQNKINEAALNVQKKESEFKQAQLDTTLTLRDAREEMQNLRFQLVEKKLIKEQSIYEAPAVIKQVDLDYEKTLRSVEQKEENYKTKVAQAVTKMQIINSDLSKERNKLNDLMSTAGKLNIQAPIDGMVIYDRDWDGKKKVVGSMINMWNPVVAALPDLSVMQTVTYINEVDVQKIKPKQKVEIKLDADPTKKLTGEVLTVASMGEQRPNSDAKVFEVVISVEQKDSTLRPSMSTSCNIVCGIFTNVVHVPLEALHTEKEVTFVVVKDGARLYRRQVKTGEMNETNIIIREGLTGEEKVYLSTPADMDKLELVPLTSTTAKR